jgi:hypothetical protein
VKTQSPRRSRNWGILNPRLKSAITIRARWTVEKELELPSACVFRTASRFLGSVVPTLRLPTTLSVRYPRCGIFTATYEVFAHELCRRVAKLR